MIRGVIFDKDGTLLAFDPLWRGIGTRLAAEFLRRMDIPAEKTLEAMLSQSIGAVPFSSSGAFACGTYQTCGNLFAEVLEGYGYRYSGEEIARQLEAISDFYSCSEEAVYQPTCDLADLLQSLRGLGIKTGIVTADTTRAAKYAAERLGISALLDWCEGADSSTIGHKPHRAAAERFCRAFGLQPKEVAVAGDSLTDMSFAGNAGCKAIGVLSGVGTENELMPYADVIIPNVSHITGELLNRLA